MLLYINAIVAKIKSCNVINANKKTEGLWSDLKVLHLKLVWLIYISSKIVVNVRYYRPALV